MARRRLDLELVRRGLAPSREAARRLIDERGVLVGGAIAMKAARQVDGAEAIELIAPPPPFVSRAGGKLASALDRFGIDPAGARCLDAGSSTGGFTDCLLQRGAASVVAVDVGTHQLHEKLRRDPRVTVREQTDIRKVTDEPPFDLTVTDVSFISLTKVMAALVALTAEGADLAVLVKPQFEAGREEASRGRGVIADPAIWRRVLDEVSESASGRGAAMLDVMVSSVPGTNGNIEFVMHLRRGGVALTPEAAATRFDAVVDEAIVVAGLEIEDPA